MSINSWEPLLNKIDNRINKVSKNLKNSMKNDLNDIKQKWPKNLPKGIIHSDLFIDNIFFYKRKFLGYIDFYVIIWMLVNCFTSVFSPRKSDEAFPPSFPGSPFGPVLPSFPSSPFGAVNSSQFPTSSDGIFRARKLRSAMYMEWYFPFVDFANT